MGALLISLSGCSPEKHVHGKLLNPEDTHKLRQGVGRLTHKDVLNLVGQPSCVLSYDPGTWYYFHVTTETTAFFTPKFTRNESFALLFTPQGQLAKYIPNAGTQDFDIALKETQLPSQHRKDFLKELFRNAGRFGKKKSDPKRRYR